jgi:hypothetical protein
MKHGLHVVVFTEAEARIWRGLPHRDEQHRHPTVPLSVSAPDPHRRHHHVRTGQARHMHHLAPDDPKFFDAVANELRDADRILLIGHGHGRSNMAQRFAVRAREHHRLIAERVIGELSVDLSAMTEPQILEFARTWYAGYCKRT